MGCLSSHIHNCKMFDLNNVTSSVDMYFQDCAGAILCAAERGTQVALQVKEHSHSFVYEFQSFMFRRSIEIEWFCTALKEPEIVVVNCTYPFHPLGFFFPAQHCPWPSESSFLFLSWWKIMDSWFQCFLSDEGKEQSRENNRFICYAISMFYDFSKLVTLSDPLLQAIQCLGGNGYVNEYPTGRLLRDAKLYEIGAGTSEIRRMIIGRELFKQ